MISRLLKVLGTLFVIIAPIVITYYFNRAAPDVRYTLSEKIPVTFTSSTNTTPETVQQLEIKNIGNALANKVVVKIDRPLTAYSIEKYSAADVVQVFDNQQHFELVYPKLPPQAGFRIVFTSPSDGIDYVDLEISHDTGVAQEALSETGRLSNIGLWVYWGGFALYILLNSWALRSSWIRSWKVNARYGNPKQILQMKKPWYAFDSEWPQLRVDVLKETLTTEYIWEGQYIQKTAAYQFLSVDSLGESDSSEHKEVIELAVDILDKAYMSSINSAYGASQNIKLLRVSKPAAFPSGKWSDLEKRANEQYVTLRKRETIYSNQDAYKKLEESKPDEIAQLAWSELISYWRGQYGEYLLAELTLHLNSLEFAKSIDISILDESSKSEWRRHVSRLQDINNESKKNEELMSLLKSLLGNKSVGETKPLLVDDWEWTRIKEIEALLMKLRDLEALGKQNKAAALEIAENRTQVSSMKEKLEKQLHFIHELLLDPTLIDRVEEYDDTFAPGNWENLQKLALTLRKPKR